jgi:hypothetical protein
MNETLKPYGNLDLNLKRPSFSNICLEMHEGSLKKPYEMRKGTWRKLGPRSLVETLP